MRNCDIAKVAGLSNATVLKILYLKDKTKYKFKPETTQKVLWLKNINEQLQEKFREPYFIKLCEIVIKRIKKRDSKKYMEIIELANCCLLLGAKKNHGIVKEIYFTAYDIFIDSDFADMCRIAVSKAGDVSVRQAGIELGKMSHTFRTKLRIK